ncbi:hypothetical protein Avbf_08395 [Armadillidium vulgare]|nr:hypothetical protein Avbf_08395 [Armadillidium vulgare]
MREEKRKNEPPLPGYTARSDVAYFTDAFNGRNAIEDNNMGNIGVSLENCDPQNPQEPQGFQESPSSDSEDTYVNGSSVNLRLSQTASNIGDIESDSVIYYDPKTLSNRVSVDQCCHAEEVSDLKTCTLNPNGSSSTPSSAYYSDMSVLELPSYRKKKKKKKGDTERKLRGSNRSSGNYSPTLANHLANIKQPLTLSNGFGIEVHNYDENSLQNLTHLSLSSNYPPVKGKCLHNSPNFIQNRTRLPENAYELCQEPQSANFETTMSSACQFIPKCKHSTPECVKYIPNLALKNTNLNNISIFQNPYIVNEETVPALIKHFDKGSAIEFINNNIASDCKTKLTNSFKFTEHTEKENCNCNFLSSQPSTVLELADDSILAEKKKGPLSQHQQPQLTNYFNGFKDIYRGEQDVYRVYSPSEVPSEYI